MRYAAFFILLVAFFSSCTSDQKVDESAVINSTLHSNSIELEYTDYESKVDSVIYQSLFKWNDNWIGIAEPMNDEKGKRGLRLQYLKMNEDSSLTFISESSYGYDSRTYYPSYFKVKDRNFFLVNTGERESWGNKVFEFENEQFKDLGFIDAALVKRNEAGSETKYTHLNIAQVALMKEVGEGIELSFSGDSLVLFDDGQGGYDKIVHSVSLKYTLLGDQFSMQTNF